MSEPPFNLANLGCKYAEPEPMIAVMTPEYDWDPTKSIIEISELQDKPLIIYRRFEQLIRETCSTHGFEPTIFCKNDDARTTLLWANAGLGIGIVTRTTFELANNTNLVYKKIECANLRTQIAAIWMKDKYLSTIAAKFLESFSEDNASPI